jgi:hypothetical protein
VQTPLLRNAGRGKGLLGNVFLKLQAKLSLR